jgi:hypothetical protein
MNDDSVLHEQARNLILAAILPNRPPDRMWGGAGSGAPCMVCRLPVKHEQTGLEIEYALHDGAGTSNHHVHVRCYSALETERQKIHGTPPGFGVGSAVSPPPGRLGDGREGA